MKKLMKKEVNSEKNPLIFSKIGISWKNSIFLL